MTHLTLILSLLLTFTCVCYADYRAYELSIDNLSNGKNRKVVSTLDQYQYASYYPLDPGEQVTYLRSWKCWGRTDHYGSICSAPGEPESTPKPISTP